MSKETEYTMLKQEIINTSDIIVNITIAMYTISITIFVFALEFKNCYAFLFPYMILFPFQNMINRKRDGINRIAAYISVYLEKGKGWESRISKNIVIFRGLDKHQVLVNRIWNFIIGRTNSSQIGLLSTIFFLYTYANNVNVKALTIENYCLLFLSVILFIILFWGNKRELSNMSTRDLYIERLKQAEQAQKTKKR